MKTKYLFIVILSLLYFSSCTKDNYNLMENPENLNQANDNYYNPTQLKSTTVFLVSQDFESASKTSYAAANVAFGSESWLLNDALLGTTTSDRKNNLKSVRIRYVGTLEMNYDVQNAGNVSFYYAKYGTDGNSAFDVQYSTNGGSSWTTLGSCSVTSTTLQTAEFEANVSGNVRFRILKTSGGSARINIDDFQISEMQIASVESLSENFESANKTSYTAASITINSNSWYLGDALVGTTTSDRKNGTKSVRIRNVGSLAMNFDVADATNVTFYYAKYGTDGNSAFNFQYSTNGGSSWTTVGSCSVTSTSLTQASFDVNISGNARFRVLKTSGGSARINIDDFVINSGSSSSNTTEPTRDDNLAMGNPSNALFNVAYYTNYLMTKDQFTISYNSQKSCANWVSWHLSSAWLGDAPRFSGDFYKDATLPSGWYQVLDGDYTNTGFDRGHMCPSADRNGDYYDNKATFVTTNIVPQAPYNNQRAWKELEDYCRDLAEAGYEMYIISGTYGTGGTGTYGYATTIDGGNINVPNAVWKVIVVLPVGSNDVSRVNTSTTVISVYMPNQDLGSTPWTSFCQSVDYIENKTGYDLLSNIPVSTQSTIESRVFNGSLL